MTLKTQSIIFLILGVFILISAFNIQRSKNINMIQGFLHKNVRKKEKANYCKEFAVVLYVFGAGSTFLGVSYFLDIINIGQYILIATLIVSAVLLIRVQRKYNSKTNKK